MTAPRHERAADWNRAAAVRDEWLGFGTACGSTGHAAAEQAVTDLYRRLGRPRPEFVWVRSPREAQPLVQHLPTLQDLHTWVTQPPPGRRPPLASDLAASLARMRGAMDDRIIPPLSDPKPPKREKGRPWPNQTVEAALAYGIPFVDIVRRHVRDALFTSLADGFYLPGKRLLGTPGPVCWYGQQEAHWIAYYEVWRRLGLAAYGSALDAELDTWQALARSAGWFWPDETRCVISARPVRGATFADGWSITPSPATTG
ncbi:hypothetical protein [Catellatospora vulcania]|uniref:hypothetical protein n=1 Tax=Catellatospora vulcania TaxID=1460450 RepID=UPI0012D4279E|nr:hypothetical protein [Catellatospora vulcania]